MGCVAGGVGEGGDDAIDVVVKLSGVGPSGGMSARHAVVGAV